LILTAGWQALLPLVEAAPPSFEGVGHEPKGVKWFGTKHELPEGSLKVGFGSDPED
jgi:hypothetical protein